MNIEDCEVGMKVKSKNDMSIDKVRKGDVVEITKIDIDKENTNEGGYIYFNNNCVGVSSEHFELVNQFEVGDEVYYKEYDKIMSFRGYKKDGTPIIESNKTGHLYSPKLSRLSPLKKKDELEPGDKFRINEIIFGVLAVEYDEYYNCKSYFSKIVNGNHKGKILSRLSTNIDKIIYE